MAPKHEPIVECDPPIEPCLTYEDVAGILGVSTRTLRRLIYEDLFPAPFYLRKKPLWIPQVVRDHLERAHTKAKKRKN